MRDTDPIKRSLSTRDAALAKAMERMLGALADLREWWALDAIRDDRTTVARVYDHWSRRDLDALRVELDDLRLAPLVDDWQAWLAKRGTPNERERRRYAQQLGTFVGPETRRSQYTRAALSSWLSGLTVGATNRYHAAAASFGTFLVERGLIEANPMRGIRRAKEAAPRTRFLERDDAARVLAALAGPARVFHALAAATGMEYGALIQVRRRDLDLTEWTVRARGSKTEHRNRTIHVRDVYGARDILRAAAAKLLPEAKLCALGNKKAVAALRDALAACDLPIDLTTHDWRHTFAVQVLRDGWPLHLVAHQLGHGSSVLTQRVYGRFIPTATDYLAAQKSPQSAISDPSTEATA
jgi:integrase